MSQLVTRSRDPEPSLIARYFARHSHNPGIPEAMKTAVLAMALWLLLLSQVVPGNLDPFRGTELESGSA